MISENLNREFQQNKKLLTETIYQVDECFKSGEKILELVGRERSVILGHNIDSLLSMSFKYNRFSPSENVISDLVLSGRLKILLNDLLKDKIYEWSLVKIEFNEQFEGLDENFEEILKYLLTLITNLSN